MKIDLLLQVLYTVLMVILAFLSAVVVTKTLSKYLNLDKKVNDEDETTSPEL